MIATGHTYSQWHAEHPRARARLLAHWMERNLRENYQHEKAEKEADKKSGKKPTGKTGTDALFPGWGKKMPAHGE